MLPGAFNRRLAIIRPAPTTLSDEGDMVPDGQPFEFLVWGSWKEDMGSESLTEDQEFNANTITITTWDAPEFAALDGKWTARSESGEELEIISVTRRGVRDGQVTIRAIRRE